MNCKDILAEDYKQYQTQLREQMQKLPRGSKQWWALNRRLLNQTSSLSSILPLRKSGTSPWITAPCAKADVVAETFMAKSTLPEPTSLQQTYAPPHVQMADFAVLRTRWAKKILKRINQNKAAGPDGIPGRLLKECATELSAIIVRIARRCISEAAWPRLWRYHWIQPLQKEA